MAKTGRGQKMTVARLKRARGLPREIAVLEAEITEMREGDGGIGSDTVLDYRTGYGIPRAVTGFDWQRYDRKRKLLEKKRGELQAVTEWVDGIDDVQAQAVIRMRYLEGLGWGKIALKMGMPQNEDYPRLRIQDAYFKKIGMK